MQRELLQEKSLSRKQGNAEKSLDVDLSAKSRLIPYSTAAGMIGLNDLYLEERNACLNYRMIFTVNPVCTNVLYNAVTEPIFMEGSDSAISLVYSAVQRDNEDVFPYGTINRSGDTVDQIAAVRDTEYSHEKIGNFKYHCGYDIFNNHLLRTDDFEHARLADELRNGKKRNEMEFNTIFDFAIDFSGKTVQRVIDDWKGPASSITREDIRMYQLDNIKSINKAFYDELREVDGWYGFYNSGYINIPNAKLNDGKDVSVNKILNNEVPCGFIDLYPDRTLYSFIPKVNRYRKRLERNWDCTIVYPYKCDYNTFAIINENEAGAVKVLRATVTYDNTGEVVLEMHSLLRHSLVGGDNVQLYYRDGEEGELKRFNTPVKVMRAGDSKGNDIERCFLIKLADIETFCTRDEENDKRLVARIGSGASQNDLYFYYRKNEDGYEDKYYFRVFKEIKYYEYSQCSPEEIPTGETVVKAIREPSIITEKSPNYIRIGNDYFEKIGRPLTYTQNKIAFAENIYGDRVAQVIFNDDICTAGLTDNLGRPLSRVYFTTIKTNRGHEEWYGPSGITSAETIEFSHCFGEVTSGLDLPEDSASTEYNVRKLYNIFSGNCDIACSLGLEAILEEAPKGNYSGTPTPLESAITLDNYDEFLGDIVEYSKVRFQETTIEKVYHRFNTAQRECVENPAYFKINYDELVSDLYDVEETNE